MIQDIILVWWGVVYLLTDPEIHTHTYMREDRGKENAVERDKPPMEDDQMVVDGDHLAWYFAGAAFDLRSPPLYVYWGCQGRAMELSRGAESRYPGEDGDGSSF